MPESGNFPLCLPSLLITLEFVVGKCDPGEVHCRYRFKTKYNTSMHIINQVKLYIHNAVCTKKDA